MKLYLLFPFLVSFFSSLILVPVVKRIAFSLKAFGPELDASIPRLGGVAIYFSFLLSLTGFFFYRGTPSELFLREGQLHLGIFLGGTFVLILGIWDDLKNISPLKKLMIELVIASFVYACGFRILSVSSFSGQSLPLGLFSFPATVFWIVGLMNALNLSDGIDGLASGITLFTMITLGTISFMNGNELNLLLCCALGGSLLGFIRYNFNPAQIYLGDSGSLFLGYLLSIFSIWGSAKASTLVAILTPLIALGIPLIDMLVSIARRYFRGLPIFRRDLEHVHHRLRTMGLSQRKAVLVLYAFCILLNGLALYLYLSKNPTIVLAFIVLGTLFGLKHLGYLKPHLLQDRFEEFQKIRKERFCRYLMRDLVDKLDAQTLQEKISILTKGFSEKAGFNYSRLELYNDDSQSFEWSSEGYKKEKLPCAQIILPLLKGSQVIGKLELRKNLPYEKDSFVFLGAELLVKEVSNVLNQ